MLFLRRLVFVLLTLVSVSVVAQDRKPLTSSTGEWPQFLGPTQNGISTESGLIDGWPAAGPAEIWRTNIGTGMSTVAVSNGRLYTVAQSKEHQFAIAVDAKSGKEIWSRELSAEYRNQMGDGPRATPAVAGELVYVHTGEGILAALKTSDGSIVWKKDLVQELGGKPIEYGISSSPLLVGNLVVVQPGVSGGTVVACDQRSGRIVWKSGAGSAAYSSPVLLNVGRQQQVVAFTGPEVLGLEPTTGKQLWNYPFKTDYDCNTANPIAVGNKVLVSSGENHGSALLSIDGGRVKEVWTSFGRNSVLRAEWQTPVLIDGHLYGFDNVGSAGPVTNFACIEAKTGRRVWEKKRFGKGNLVAADGKLFISTMKGELVLVAATADSFKELARSKEGLVDTTRQAPVIADGKLYLRGTQELVCLDVKQK
jgi:outer membrane protein assembly factor BamB